MNRRTLLLLLPLLLIKGVCGAEGRWLNIYRNDRMFHSFEMTDITTFDHIGTNSQGFHQLHIKDRQGRETNIPLANIDEMRLEHHIPEIFVNLTDYPEIEDLFKTGGYTKSSEYAATLEMKGYGAYDDLPLQNVVFRGRGNSTWGMPKTPYRFKMAKKTAVAGMKKAKSFALIANYIDPSLMCNAIALWIARRIGMPFANHCIPVDVHLNGNYRGSYFITEKIGIGGGSVDINGNQGMLLELDIAMDEDNCFWYSLTDHSIVKYGEPKSLLPVMCKDPNLMEIMDERGEPEPQQAAATYWKEWNNDICNMLSAVTTRDTNESLGDVIDLGSCVNFFLVNAIANNHELCHPKSLYIYKESLSPDDKYHFGPVWDFDWAFNYLGNSYSGVLADGGGLYGGNAFIKALFSNSEFMSLFKKRLAEFVADDYDDLIDFIEDYAMTIRASAKANGVKWDDDNSVSWRPSKSSFEHEKAVADLKLWIERRINYMSRHARGGLY